MRLALSSLSNALTPSRPGARNSIGDRMRRLFGGQTPPSAGRGTMSEPRAGAGRVY